MIIKSVQLKNIRSYVNQTIELPQGSVMLSGDVGSGKSSILMAMVFALFSPIRNELSGGALLRHGAQSGFIEIIIEVGGKTMKIRRNLSRARGGTIQQGSGYIEIDGVRHDLSATQIKARMLEELGYPSELLTKHSMDIFQFTVYTPQEQIKQIITAEIESRKQSLNSVFDIDRYKIVKDGASQTVTEINRMVKMLKKDAKGLDESKAELEEGQKALKEGTATLTHLKKEIKNVEEEKRKVDKQVSEIQEELKELAGLESSLEATNELKEAQEGEVSQSKQKLEDITKSLENYQGQFAVKQKEFKPIKEDEKDLRALLQSLESNIKQNSTASGEINQRISDLQEILEKGICATCEQEVQDPASFQGKINTKKEQQKKLVGENQNLETEIEKTNAILKTLSDNKLVQTEIDNLKANIDRLKKEQTENTAIISGLEKKLTGIIQKLKGLQSQIASKEKVKEMQEPLKQQMDAVQQKLIDLTGKEKELEERMRIYKVLIKGKQEEITKKEKALQEANHLQEVSYWLKGHLPNLLDEMEAQATAKILYDFDDLFKKWFGVLMQDVSIDVRLDEGFTPIIIQNGYETDFKENLSGGEGTSVALSYRLALNQVINNQKEDIKTKELLILDEPTDGFSREQLKRVRDVFNLLNASQLIVVSHEPEVEGFVNHVIKIEKKNSISRIAKN